MVLILFPKKLIDKKDNLKKKLDNKRKIKMDNKNVFIAIALSMSVFAFLGCIF